MNIRGAVAEDVTGVLPMVEKLATLHEQWDPIKYGYLPNPAEMYRRWLRSRATDARSVFIVAEHEGKIVAFVVGTTEEEIPIYRTKEFGFIHDLWVDEKYRNEGIARQMVMLAIEKFREIGVLQIRLDTAAKNEAARKLFESCGFRPSVVEMLIEI
jgi:ribosomal protein S18 acetylase RimI-like enzyme